MTHSAAAVLRNSSELDALVADCVKQMERFRRKQANDPTSCLQLFHQAILQRDPAAWEALVTVYQPQIRRWIQKQGNIADAALVNELVQETLIRFWRSYTPELFVRARSLADILRYWQDCAHSAYLEWQRRNRNAPVLLEEIENGSVSQTASDILPHNLVQAEARNRLWQLVLEQCRDELDRLLAHRIFVEGQKPREVFRENPERFESIEEVYKRLRNLKDRLRRNPNLLELLEICS